MVKSSVVAWKEQITIDTLRVEAFLLTKKVIPDDIAQNRYGIVFWFKSGTKIGWEFTSQEECLNALAKINKVMSVRNIEQE